MSLAKKALSALRKVGIVFAIAIAFIFGLAGTVYLSFRNPEVKVPDVVGKDYLTAESALSDVGLNIHKRATRYSPDAKPNTILDQFPHSGETVKEGSPVAVILSRTPNEGESGATPEGTPTTNGQENNQNTDNSSNANVNQNENKKKKNKNSNNSNNSNNANNSNGNANNRNANNRNASSRNNSNNGNANNRNSNNGRNANNGNRNSNVNANGTRNNSNANKRTPNITPSATPTGKP